MSLSIPPTGTEAASGPNRIRQAGPAAPSADRPSSVGEGEGVGGKFRSGAAQASPAPSRHSLLQEDPTDVVDIGMYSGTNMYYAEVIDRRSHELVRYIPPEAILRLFARIHQDSGLKVDSKV